MPQGYGQPQQNTRPGPYRLRQDLGYVPAKAPTSGGNGGGGSGILISGGNQPVISSSRIMIKAIAALAYVLLDADFYTFLNFTAASPVTFTVPSDATLASSLIGGIVPVVAFQQGGAGQITVAAGAGVTINTLAVFKPKSAAQFGVLQLIWTAPNTWTLFGAQELA